MSDNSRHITSFKVKNFKRFESFEMNDLGQFNLIVGDNNVGKTSLLEMLLVDELNVIATITNYRQALLNHKVFANPKFREFSYFRNLETSINEILFSSTTVDRKFYEVRFNFDSVNLRFKIFGIQNREYDYFYNDALFSIEEFSVPLIPFSKGYDSDLVNFYSRFIQSLPKEKELLFEYMRIFIPDLIYIEPSAPKSDESIFLIVTQKSKNSTLPLGFYGEGTVKLFRILLEIIANKGKRLMIDEVDTGIHYSRFSSFWNVILLAAVRHNVQLFMTTHNEECIKYFVDVLSEPKMKSYQKDARSISLVELPDKSVKAYTYPFGHLEANILMGNDVRGGAR